MAPIITDIGSRLRQAREDRGLALRDIATTTKISTSALAAIERNEFARLPGGVFRRAYIKAFATEVGLDGNELARDYRAAFEPEPAAAPAGRKPRGHEGIRFAPRLPAVAAAIAAISIIGALIYQRQRDQPPANAVEAQTEVPDVTDVQQQAALVGKASNDAGTASNDAGLITPALRLEIQTSELCWVSAAADGARAVYRLMQPGERALVQAQDAITLRVGNAGAVVYSINGAAGTPLGDDGEAVTVKITDDNLETVASGEPRPLA